MKNTDEHELLKRIDREKLPAHVAIIMDGNGRWAKARNLPRTSGHRQGVKSTRAVIEGCIEAGIKFLTLYAFSTENWQRPKSEVSVLMGLLLRYLRAEEKNMQKERIRFNTIGDAGRLPEKIGNEIERIKRNTSKNERLTLNLALNYGGRQEIINAARLMSASGKTIDENTFAEFLYTAGQPDPDLLIRTSNEMRISNFLLWQLAYTEFVFTDVLWPDFRKPDLYKAILEYQNRNRRFGKL